MLELKEDKYSCWTVSRKRGKDTEGGGEQGGGTCVVSMNSLQFLTAAGAAATSRRLVTVLSSSSSSWTFPSCSRCFSYLPGVTSSPWLDSSSTALTSRVTSRERGRAVSLLGPCWEREQPSLRPPLLSQAPQASRRWQEQEPSPPSRPSCSSCTS
eukprot:485620-Hanusia_phi.AAC.3